MLVAVRANQWSSQDSDQISHRFLQFIISGTLLSMWSISCCVDCPTASLPSIPISNFCKCRFMTSMSQTSVSAYPCSWYLERVIKYLRGKVSQWNNRVILALKRVFIVQAVEIDEASQCTVHFGLQRKYFIRF
jgi:hypothetical protein